VFASFDYMEDLTSPLRRLSGSSLEALTVGDEGRVPDTLFAGTVSPPAADKGRSFGGYEILDELGTGGMGVVYRARQVELKRTVALKMIRAGAWATDAESLRFRNEAAASLDHPHIVSVHEVGSEHGQLHYTMRLVDRHQ
jgi:serine/threonine protein kinase